MSFTKTPCAVGLMLLAWLKKRGARKTTALKSHASVAFSGGEALIEETVASRSPACQSSYKVEQARFLAVALAVGLALCWPVGLLAWLLCWLRERERERD